MKEIKDLKRELNRIAAKYSNTNYRILSKDELLWQIPEELYNLWYSPTSLSVVSLMYCETLTQQDLDSLEEQLHNEFEKLEKKYVS